MSASRSQELVVPPSVERLAGELVGRDDNHPFGSELAVWLASSRRFRAFSEAHRGKIRKKLRGAVGDEDLRDVRTELQLARLLLADRRIELAFEAYGSGRAGPDFTVTFGGRRFNVEVTRLRHATDRTGISGRLLAKLQQLPPSTPNLVVVSTEGTDASALDIAGEIRALRARADGKDEAWFEHRGFNGTRGFYERFLRLGGVIAWAEQAVGDLRAALWINRSARSSLPDRAGAACLRCLRADAG